MGGRLDAVNILDADCAIVTSIDIDHAEYLGDTRDKIGFEKAGIFRPGRPAICADVMPPQSLVQHAEKINANLWLFGRDFRHDVQPGSGREHWNYVGPTTHIPALPRPNLKGVNQLFNASAALAGLEALSARLPVTELDVSRGLARVTLPGRFQVVAGPPTVVLDVGHNPHASANLARNLNNMGSVGSTYAVFGAMRDKDISGVLTNLKNEIDHWHLTELSTPRSASIAQLSESLRAAEIIETNANKIRGFMSPAAAFEDALRRAGLEDRIVVFGSFYTVAGVIEYRTATDELACSDATGRKNNFCNERRVVAMAEAEYKEGSTDSQREAEGQFGRAYASKEGALRKGRAERNVGNWAWMEAGHHYDWMDQHAPFENL
jgi:dihydrofolate synthase/folylpolyglutamate synthase